MGPLESSAQGGTIGGTKSIGGTSRKQCAPSTAGNRPGSAPMLTNKLTDTAIRKAKHGDKSVKMSDGGGLYLGFTRTGRATGA